jgi:hypothetical protein
MNQSILASDAVIVTMEQEILEEWLDPLKQHCMKLFNWTNTRLVLMIESFFLFHLHQNAMDIEN